MSSLSLRDQLIAAGLATEKQARKSAPPQRAPSRHKPVPSSEQKLAAERAQAAKTARDQELNRQRQRSAEAKARAEQIKQLMDQHRLPKVDSEDRFNFIHGKKLRFIAVDGPMREGLNRGTLVIIRYDGRSEVVPAAAADRIRECDPRPVVSLNAEAAPVDENDPYKDFVVPDDLKW
jgi:uncharacterized protein YaiL (DUF2058 family)